MYKIINRKYIFNINRITFQSSFRNIMFQTISKFKFSSKKLIMEEDNPYDEDLFYKKYNAIFKLKNRSVISVTGEDADSFLQSMITNDMKQLKNDKVAMAALFLNPKGRVLYDSFVVKSDFSDQKYPDYWLDVNEKIKDELINHLTSHCLRKRVQIQDLSGFLSVHSAICLYVGPENEKREEGMIWKELQGTAEYTPSDENPHVLVTDSMSFYDPRLRAIGCRIICPTDSLEIEKDIVNYKMTSEDYDIIRLLYGIPEGPDEVEGSLPLNMNFQLLNYINFSKGCYIGQELTQRTYHTGVIRKIVMPFICTEKLKFKIGDEEEENFQGHVIIPYQSVDKSFTTKLKHKEIINSNGEVVGIVIKNLFNCGIAMVEREKLESSGNLKFTIDGLNTIIYDPIQLWDSIRQPIKEEENNPIENTSKSISFSKSKTNPSNSDSD